MNPIAIVTGAGSGIGRAVSLALIGAGYSVALVGRRREALEETAGKADAGSRVLVAPTDVAEEASVTSLFEIVAARFGRLDLLFNNAGANAPALPIDALSLAQWNDVISVNITGAFLCARAAFRQMKTQQPQGGRIINNGSIAAQMPRPNAVPYSASKHAVTGLTKSLALEGRAFGISCGQIDIGNASTAMTAAMSKGVLQADGSMKTEPTFDMRQVAEAVLFMAKLPPDTNVLSMTIMATTMPFVGRG